MSRTTDSLGCAMRTAASGLLRQHTKALRGPRAAQAPAGSRRTADFPYSKSSQPRGPWGRPALQTRHCACSVHHTKYLTSPCICMHAADLLSHQALHHSHVASCHMPSTPSHERTCLADTAGCNAACMCRRAMCAICQPHLHLHPAWGHQAAGPTRSAKNSTERQHAASKVDGRSHPSWDLLGHTLQLMPSSTAGGRGKITSHMVATGRWCCQHAAQPGRDMHICQLQPRSSSGALPLQTCQRHTEHSAVSSSQQFTQP